MNDLGLHLINSVLGLLSVSVFKLTINISCQLKNVPGDSLREFSWKLTCMDFLHLEIYF